MQVATRFTQLKTLKLGDMFMLNGNPYIKTGAVDGYYALQISGTGASPIALPSDTLVNRLSGCGIAILDISGIANTRMSVLSIKGALNIRVTSNSCSLVTYSRDGSANIIHYLQCKVATAQSYNVLNICLNIKKYTVSSVLTLDGNIITDNVAYLYNEVVENGEKLVIDSTEYTCGLEHTIRTLREQRSGSRV